MSASDDPKAAPSLADEFLEYYQFSDASNEEKAFNARIAAALRAVEAVRAFQYPPLIAAHLEDAPVKEFDNEDYADGYRDGVEAVQALLTDVAVTQTEDSATIAAHEEPLAAIIIAPPDDGHKAGPSQALLEGERDNTLWRVRRGFSHLHGILRAR